MSFGEYGQHHTDEGEPINRRIRRQGDGGREKWVTKTEGGVDGKKHRHRTHLKEVVPLTTAKTPDYIPLEEIPDTTVEVNPEDALARREGEKLKKTKGEVYPVDPKLPGIEGIITAKKKGIEMVGTPEDEVKKNDLQGENYDEGGDLLISKNKETVGLRKDVLVGNELPKMWGRSDDSAGKRGRIQKKGRE